MMKLCNFRKFVPDRVSGGRAARQRARGQSLLEMALVLPVLILLFAVVIEGGLALNAWMRVNTAARDATRFVMDAGRPSDAATLVRNKLAGIDFGSGKTMTNSLQLNIYLIKGTTNDQGNIPNPPTPQYWTTSHLWGGGPDSPKLQASTIQQRLQSQDGQSPSASANVPFTIVEVDYNYLPVVGTIVNRVLIPMTSYALVQQYTQVQTTP